MRGIKERRKEEMEDAPFFLIFFSKNN